MGMGVMGMEVMDMGMEVMDMGMEVMDMGMAGMVGMVGMVDMVGTRKGTRKVRALVRMAAVVMVEVTNNLLLTAPGQLYESIMTVARRGMSMLETIREGIGIGHCRFHCKSKVSHISSE